MGQAIGEHDFVIESLGYQLVRTGGRIRQIYMLIVNRNDRVAQCVSQEMGG